MYTGAEGKEMESSDATGHPASPCKASWQTHLPGGHLKSEISLNQKFQSKQMNFEKGWAKWIPARLQTLIRGLLSWASRASVSPAASQLTFYFSRLLYPVSRPWASRRRPTHLGLLVFTGPGAICFLQGAPQGNFAVGEEIQHDSTTFEKQKREMRRS